MTNQATPVTPIRGYRSLSTEELALINRIKDHAASIQALVDEVRAFSSADQRWAAIGITDLQKGFMSLTRAVAKPDSF